MKILFISRAYPPIVGGIEMQNYGIGQALSKITETKIIANKKGKKNLLPFLFWATIKSLVILRNYDMVLLGDGVLSPLGFFLKIFYHRKKFISIIHGLDITFAHKKSLLGIIYRTINIPCHKKLDKLIMVGQETVREAIKIGILKEKCVFIPNGLEIEEICLVCNRQDLEKLLKIDLSYKKVIFRGGRFVKHKGVTWFIKHVMPKLPENFILVAAGGMVYNKTAGDENDYPNAQKAVKDLQLEKRVILLGNLPRPDMKILFNAADIYISPNVKVPGSMEGFGIPAIEAGACGKVVLAANIEGLKDAIQDGQNGFLVETGNADAWAQKITEILNDDNFRKEFGIKASQYVLENYSWSKIAQKYLEAIEKVAKK